MLDFLCRPTPDQYASECVTYIRTRSLVLWSSAVFGLAVSALAAVEQPITVASAKTADVAKPILL